MWRMSSEIDQMAVDDRRKRKRVAVHWRVRLFRQPGQWVCNETFLGYQALFRWAGYGTRHAVQRMSSTWACEVIRRDQEATDRSARGTLIACSVLGRLW